MTSVSANCILIISPPVHLVLEKEEKIHADNYQRCSALTRRISDSWELSRTIELTDQFLSRNKEIIAYNFINI